METPIHVSQTIVLASYLSYRIRDTAERHRIYGPYTRFYIDVCETILNEDISKKTWVRTFLKSNKMPVADPVMVTYAKGKAQALRAKTTNVYIPLEDQVKSILEIDEKLVFPSMWDLIELLLKQGNIWLYHSTLEQLLAYLCETKFEFSESMGDIIKYFSPDTVNKYWSVFKNVISVYRDINLEMVLDHPEFPWKRCFNNIYDVRVFRHFEQIYLKELKEEFDLSHPFLQRMIFNCDDLVKIIDIDERYNYACGEDFSEIMSDLWFNSYLEYDEVLKLYHLNKDNERVRKLAIKNIRTIPQALEFLEISKCDRREFKDIRYYYFLERPYEIFYYWRDVMNKKYKKNSQPLFYVRWNMVFQELNPRAIEILHSEFADIVEFLSSISLAISSTSKTQPRKPKFNDEMPAPVHYKYMLVKMIFDHWRRKTIMRDDFHKIKGLLAQSTMN